MSDEIKYLWEVPCNLCSKPKKYKVIKETEKTYLIGEYVQERVLKSRMGTNYVRYFESEEEAWKYYNTGKEEEKNKAIARDMATRLKGGGKFLLEYTLVEHGEPLMKYPVKTYIFYAPDNTKAMEYAANFLKDENKELLDGEYIQKMLSRLVSLEDM